mmetsp:Transcript_17592/g.39787  ORF Transcript_17592/g.39787 Transcript_17592/m.39787 type:complete len:168 (-) Transcript_17592:45-548(-)
MAILSFDQGRTPAALAVSEHLKFEAAVELRHGQEDACLELPGGRRIHGDDVICRFMARKKEMALYGGREQDAVAISEIDEYLLAAYNHQHANEAALARLKQHLDSRLRMRAYVVGYELSLADVALWVLLAFSPPPPHLPHLSRWMQHMSSLPASEKFLKFVHESIRL